MEFQEPVFLIIYTQNSCLLNIYNLKQNVLIFGTVVSELHFVQACNDKKRQFGLAEL